MDILDNEASEDEAMRKDAAFDRPASYEANVELIEKERRYRDILVRASVSDETVRQKWDEWEGDIVQLTADEVSHLLLDNFPVDDRFTCQAELEAAVPSTNLSPSNRSSVEAADALKHSRALRVALEALDSLHRELQDFVRRAQSLADADDIYPRVLSAASGLEKLAEVKPEMFEDVSDQELAKYDKFLEEINRGESRQAELLATIEVSSVLIQTLVGVPTKCPAAQRAILTKSKRGPSPQSPRKCTPRSRSQLSEISRDSQEP
jgi:programmed cell death 6-interacting protein